jgi:long-chain acyl-CoA synthetase
VKSSKFDGMEDAQMNMALWLARSARAAGTQPALFLGQDLVCDYAAFAHRAGAFATGLREHGVGPGDRVGIYMANCPDYLIALFGTWYAGAVAVPVNAKLHGKEAAWILDHAGASICFSSRGLDEALQDGGYTGQVEASTPTTGTALEAPIDREPQDLAWLFYTSGTTGRPKGVMITHRMLATMALSYFANVDAVAPSHATLYAAPMSHGAGIYSLMHVLKGARHVCPRSGSFDPAEIFDLAAHFGNMHLFAAPTMVKRLTQVAVATGRDGSGLRRIVYGGGPMYVADILEAVDRFGPIFSQIYGQGEAPMAITALSAEDISDRTHPNWRARLGSVGRAQSGVELRIADIEGNAVPVGQPGEILARGDLVMPGYWRNPEGTSAALRDGWLWTGDVGVMDADGYLTLQDRSKDVIISGGSNIYPREVEECLLLHPSVSEVSVVGRANEEWGEDVVAFVVGQDGPIDEACLDAHCRDHIARFKRPKKYVCVSELPKNNYGKVLKTELRVRLKTIS